jgi:hypothetical protein
MTPGGDASVASIGGDNSTTRYCPDCGQPLALARAQPVQRNVISWRSVFVVAVGLLLSITFGMGALRAEQANQFATACPGTGVEMGCASAPRGLAQQLTSQYLRGGDVLAPRITDRDVGSDLRFLVVGLAGLGVGLGAALLRLRRPRRLVFGMSLLAAVEGLFTVFYGQVLLIGVYLLVDDTPSGTPLTFGTLGDSLFRALSMVFALVGVR